MSGEPETSSDGRPGLEHPAHDREEDGDEGPHVGLGLAGVGTAALAAVCCASVPLLLAVLSGVTLGVLLGVGAGILAVIAITGFVVSAVRRRRACDVPGRGYR